MVYNPVIATADGLDFTSGSIIWRSRFAHDNAETVIERHVARCIKML